MTTTVLPLGPINNGTKLFRSSRGLFAYHNRILVKKQPSSNTNASENFEWPANHYIDKVIIPDLVILEGGIRTKAQLLQTLDHFAQVPNRKIVFQKKIPRGGVNTKITLPLGPIGIVFDQKQGLPVVSMVFHNSWGEKLNIPVGYYVEKLIVPNAIAIERLSNDTFEPIFNHYDNIEGRTLVLQEIRNDIPNTGGTITLRLPTGDLGIVFRSTKGYITVARVNPTSPLQRAVKPGYVVGRFVIPGEFELVGLGSMTASTFTDTLRQFAGVEMRVLVLKERRGEVRIGSSSYTNELGSL